MLSNETRQCSNCRETKDLAQDFYRKGKKSDGSPRYQYRCKACNPEVVRGYTQNNPGRENTELPRRASFSRVIGNPLRMEPAYAK